MANKHKFTNKILQLSMLLIVNNQLKMTVNEQSDRANSSAGNESVKAGYRSTIHGW